MNCDIRITIKCSDGEFETELMPVLRFAMPVRKSRFDCRILEALELPDFACETARRLFQFVCNQCQGLQLSALPPDAVRLMDYLGASADLWALAVETGQWEDGLPHAPELAAALRGRSAAELWMWLRLDPLRFAAALAWWRGGKNLPKLVAPERGCSALTLALQQRMEAEVTGKWPQNSNHLWREAALVAALRFGRPAPEPRRPERLEWAMLHRMPWAEYTPELALRTLCACAVRYGDRAREFAHYLVATGGVAVDEIAAAALWELDG